MNDNQISKYTLEGILLHFSKIIKYLIITIVIILALWFATIAGFIWYISLPAEESVTSEQIAEDIDSSTITQRVGD